jgi:hypothetical protein
MDGSDNYDLSEKAVTSIAVFVDSRRGVDRVTANSDQGNPDATTLQHLDPTLGQTADGSAERGADVEDHIAPKRSQ